MKLKGMGKDPVAALNTDHPANPALVVEELGKEKEDFGDPDAPSSMKQEEDYPEDTEVYDSVTYEEAKAITENIMDWYFDTKEISVSAFTGIAIEEIQTHDIARNLANYFSARALPSKIATVSPLVGLAVVLIGDAAWTGIQVKKALNAQRDMVREMVKQEMEKQKKEQPKKEKNAE